ncbi:hypothetical protein Tco_1157027 [Tanacetum coccineum]
MNLKWRPLRENNNEQPNEGVCRVDNFEVIPYTIGDNEEFLAICTSECDSWHKTVYGVQVFYHESSKKDKGWTNHTAYPRLDETMNDFSENGQVLNLSGAL